MKKLLRALVICAPLTFLSGCVVQTVSYEPGYRTDYVTTVGYYNNQPTVMYTNSAYGIDDYSYWGGYRFFNAY